MRRAAFWSIVTVLISAPFGAGTALAEGTLVLVNEEGEEVLRLDAENQSSGLQAIGIGRYQLKVDAPGVYGVTIGSSTVLQLDRVEDRDVDDHPENHDVGLSPVVLDADLDPGDQGQREAEAEVGDRIEFQLTVFDLPEFYGWGVTLEYDPEQIVYVADSFSPSDFVPNIFILPRVLDGGLEIGGGNLSKEMASGTGDLGSLRFEVLAGFSGVAEVKITNFIVNKLDGIDDMQVEAVAAIVSELSEDSGEEEEEVVEVILSGDEAISHLREENACPGCDLTEARLMREDLHEADLSGADLSGANLFRTDLSNAVLEGAILSGANLLQTVLREANLREADLSNGRLIGAKLQEADLTGANLDNANLSGARLTGAIWIDGTECGARSVGRCRQ